MKTRLRQADTLLRLARLREDLARRQIAAATHALAERSRELAEAETAAQALAQAQAERRETLRNPMLGSAQLRGALDSVLATFEADRIREAETLAAIAQAETRRRDAEAALAEARATFLKATQLTEKRRRSRQVLRDKAMHEAERREESEIEDLRRGVAR